MVEGDEFVPQFVTSKVVPQNTVSLPFLITVSLPFLIS